MDAQDQLRLQLELVTFEKDRQKIFEAMAARALVISALANDRAQFRFELKKIERSRLFLVLRAPAPRALRPSETLTVTFGLEEGQFFLKGTFEPVVGDLFALQIGENLYRMQRRNNFRAPVPESMGAIFRTHDRLAVEIQLPLADISAGGIGLLLNKGQGIPLMLGEQVRGTLEISGRDPMELEGVVKHIWPPDGEGTVKIGVQCPHLDSERQRELVAICMQIHRELFSIFRSFNR